MKSYIQEIIINEKSKKKPEKVYPIPEKVKFSIYLKNFKLIANIITQIDIGLDEKILGLTETDISGKYDYEL